MMKRIYLPEENKGDKKAREKKNTKKSKLPKEEKPNILSWLSCFFVVFYLRMKKTKTEPDTRLTMVMMVVAINI